MTGDQPRHLDYLPIDDVQEAPRNAKAHDLPRLRRSMTTLGFTAPAVLDERTGRLIAGHGRLATLRALRDDNQPPPAGIVVTPGGDWSIPVARGWASRDDAQAEAAVVGDNRLTEVGGWDNAALAGQLAELVAVDHDLLALAGFTPGELDELTASLTADDDEGDLDPVGDDGDGWAAVSVRVPPDVAALFNQVMNSLPGQEHEQFTSVVRAAAYAQGLGAEADRLDPFA